MKRRNISASKEVVRYSLVQGERSLETSVVPLVGERRIELDSSSISSNLRGRIEPAHDITIAVEQEYSERASRLRDGRNGRGDSEVLAAAGEEGRVLLGTAGSRVSRARIVFAAEAQLEGVAVSEDIHRGE